MSVKSKHSSKKSSAGKKEKRKKLDDSDEDFESSEEELDLTKECHPIGYYLNNRAEMIDQMFSVIKGNKLKAMLPPILKDCDIEQLKLQCLDQLLGMSDKRITCILEGESLETSSESEVMESDECNSDVKNGTTSGSGSDRSNNSEGESEQNAIERKNRKRKKDYTTEGNSKKLSRPESEPVEHGKTLLEILELEMRARAIRALLKQSGTDKGSDQSNIEPKTDVNETKDGAGEIVDLTQCEDDDFPGSIKREVYEEKNIEKKVSNFEEKIDKSKAEKTNQPQDEKFKRLQAELEIRNKLFKKKIYRTRQQRMENEEEEKGTEKNENEENNISNNGDVIKQEEAEPIEVVLEDPEEGELSTSEDEYTTQIKQEPQEPEVQPELVEISSGSRINEDAEKITAINSGIFEGKRLEDTVVCPEIKLDKKENVGGDVSNTSTNQICEGNKSTINLVDQELEVCIGETSWRDRWLQKDGVQKLVKSSKIYAKVKKRIAEKSQKAKEEILTPYETNSDSNSNSRLEMIEGSIEEYEKLLKKNEHLQQPGVNEPDRKVPESHESEKT